MFFQFPQKIHAPRHSKKPLHLQTMAEPYNTGTIAKCSQLGGEMPLAEEHLWRIRLISHPIPQIGCDKKDDPGVGGPMMLSIQMSLKYN